MRALLLACTLLAASSLLAQEPAHAAQMSSTEAARLIRWLEQAPLAEDAKKVRSDLIQWAVETKDVTITMCDVLGPVPNTNVPYGPELLVQAMLGNGAFQVHHPESKGDEMKAQLAGIESLLRAYAQILVADPAARIAQYDQWLVALEVGRLAAEVAPMIQQKCIDATSEA